MKFIYSNTSDASFNLASEEYFLKNFDEDLFFLYINSPAIVCGKHQNTLAEIDFSYTQNNNINIFRRLSGGGTVYHDLGNINFCFITNEIKGELVNFEKYLTYITKFLGTKQIEASVGKRHELIVDGKKISGNASHVYKNRVMHHGTLLFDSQLEVLNNCLKIDPLKYTDKAVKSVRSEVTNISQYIMESISAQEFSIQLFNWLQGEFENSSTYELTKIDEQNINEINRIKFSTWNWTYGYSPNYIFERSVDLGEGKQVKVEMSVSKGTISTIEFEASTPELKLLADELQSKLKNVPHAKKEIEAILSNLNTLKEKGTTLTQEKLLPLFF